MTSRDEKFDLLIELVKSGAKYQFISNDLVRSLLAMELTKRNSDKEAVKAVRGKLHQVAAAYQEKAIPYAEWLTEMKQLPPDINDLAVRAFLSRAILSHASTRERAPILHEFFHKCLEPLGSVHSVLDLACGLNPLTIPWMPLQPGFIYSAYDVYGDMVDFLNSFFSSYNLNGTAALCDVTQELPSVSADLTLVLKTIPCLEQVDKSAGQRLLDAISSPNILVSFPARSLGGRAKGMAQFYESRFLSLVAGKPWRISRFEFPGELAFLVQKY